MSVLCGLTGLEGGGGGGDDDDGSVAMMWDGCDASRASKQASNAETSLGYVDFLIRTSLTRQMPSTPCASDRLVSCFLSPMGIALHFETPWTVYNTTPHT